MSALIPSYCGVCTGVCPPYVCVNHILYHFSLLKQRRLVATWPPCRSLCLQPSANLHSLAGCLLSASCCCAHLVLGDPPGRGVDAKLLQRVDDLASRADRDCTVEDKIQMVDAGILGAEEEGTMSVSSEKKSPQRLNSISVRAQEATGRRQRDNEPHWRG